MTGSLPSELGNLTSLQYMALWENQLTGPIPPQLGQLTKLYSLGLGHNQLTGSIPPELGQLTGLDDLSFAVNQLTGPIPHQLWATHQAHIATTSIQLVDWFDPYRVGESARPNILGASG